MRRRLAFRSSGKGGQKYVTTCLLKPVCTPCQKNEKHKMKALLKPYRPETPKPRNIALRRYMRGFFNLVPSPEAQNRIWGLGLGVWGLGLSLRISSKGHNYVKEP